MTAKTRLLRRIGFNIKDARALAELTQADLAERLGVCVSYVSMLERGIRNPPVTLIAEMAEALDVPPAYFFQD